MKHFYKPGQRLLLYGFVVFLILLINGCSTPGKTRFPACRVPILVDNSGSTEYSCSQMLRLIDMVADTLPPQSHVQGFTFSGNESPDPLLDTTISGAEDIHQPIKAALQLRSDKPGTFLAPALRRIQSEVKAARKHKQTFVLVILSEGGFDDLLAIKQVADQFASQPGISAVLIGPITSEPHIAARVERAFSAFGDRLILVKRDTLSLGLDRLNEILEGKE